jgi:hypothetical protein
MNVRGDTQQLDGLLPWQPETISHQKCLLAALANESYFALGSLTAS